MNYLLGMEALGLLISAPDSAALIEPKTSLRRFAAMCHLLTEPPRCRVLIMAHFALCGTINSNRKFQSIFLRKSGGAIETPDIAGAESPSELLRQRAGSPCNNDAGMVR